MKRYAHKYLILLLAILLYLPTNSFGQTHRQAKVVVKNKTGKVINYVKVYHKYSDVFKNHQEWYHVPSGGTTNGAMIVDYNTGAFTTGRDWWIVVWTTERDQSSANIHYTDPANARAFIDGFELVWKEATPIAVAAVTGAACFVAGCGPAAPVAAVAGATLSSQVFGRMMNSESTAGFKQHILRSDDESGTNVIEIYPNGKVRFVSNSGVSETKYTSSVVDKIIMPKSNVEVSGLGINAFGGAKLGTTLKLHQACASSNPDCTWTLRSDGMIVSDKNPSLAINAWNGARHGTELRLHNSCTASNPDCTWTLRSDGMIVSDRNPNLAINAWGGARHGTVLRLHNGCKASNPDCTWTVNESGRIVSNR